MCTLYYYCVSQEARLINYGGCDFVAKMHCDASELIHYYIPQYSLSNNISNFLFSSSSFYYYLLTHFYLLHIIVSILLYYIIILNNNNLCIYILLFYAVIIVVTINYPPSFIIKRNHSFNSSPKLQWFRLLHKTKHTFF